MSGLSKYQMTDTATLHLRDAEDELMYADGADGEPDLSKPRRITFYGPGTKQHAKAQQKRTNRMMARIQRKGKADMTADEALQDAAEFLRDCTHSFENIDSEKEPAQTGDELYMEVYTNLRLTFIAQQSETFARETKNFKPGSTKS